jgi:hypothetical protein
VSDGTAAGTLEIVVNGAASRGMKTLRRVQERDGLADNLPPDYSAGQCPEVTSFDSFEIEAGLRQPRRLPGGIRARR